MVQVHHARPTNRGTTVKQTGKPQWTRISHEENITNDELQKLSLSIESANIGIQDLRMLTCIHNIHGLTSPSMMNLMSSKKFEILPQGKDETVQPKYKHYVAIILL